MLPCCFFTPGEDDWERMKIVLRQWSSTVRNSPCQVSSSNGGQTHIQPCQPLFLCSVSHRPKLTISSESSLSLSNADALWLTESLLPMRTIQTVSKRLCLCHCYNSTKWRGMQPQSASPPTPRSGGRDGGGNGSPQLYRTPGGSQGLKCLFCSLQVRLHRLRPRTGTPGNPDEAEVDSSSGAEGKCYRVLSGDPSASARLCLVPICAPLPGQNLGPRPSGSQVAAQRTPRIGTIREPFRSHSLYITVYGTVKALFDFLR